MKSTNPYIPDWFDSWDQTKDNIEWIFIEYNFKTEWDRLDMYRRWRRKYPMLEILNRVIYTLPNNRFNEELNPKGWQEFINLIEN